MNNTKGQYREAALFYVSKGLTVFPLKPKEKIPATEHGVKDATTAIEIVGKWWATFNLISKNIGIATGNTSGMIVIDIDGTNGEKSFAELSEHLGTLPENVTQITPGKIKDGQHVGKGRHLIFRYADGIGCKNGIVPNIDIKGDGGYIVAAPSIHPDGGTYQFEPGKAFDEIELADLPQAWIDFLTKPKQPAASPSTPSAAGLQSNRHQTDIERRAIAYLAKCDPATQGQNGHDTLLTIATALVRGFQIEPAQAARLAWNESERKDFDRKFNEAARLPCDKANGWLLNENKSETWTELHARHKPFHESGMDVSETWNFLNKIKSTAAICETDYPALCWYVDGLIAAGYTVLMGASKMGKSWLILSMVLLVAFG